VPSFHPPSVEKFSRKIYKVFMIIARKLEPASNHLDNFSIQDYHASKQYDYAFPEMPNSFSALA